MKDLSNDMLQKLAFTFGLDKAPNYFAGGHEWSDGVIYQGLAKNGEVLIKLIPMRLESDVSMYSQRLDFASFLSNRGVATPKLIMGPQGSLISRIYHDNQDYLCFAWIKITADNIKLGDPAECEGFYTAWGKLLGQMHRHSKDYIPQNSVHLSSIPQASKLKIEDEWQHFHNYIPDTDVVKAWDSLCEELSTLARDKDSFGMIHNDLHPGNLLQSPDGLVVLDFEVANYAWFVQDLAICIYSEFARVEFHSPFKNRLPQMKQFFLEPFMSAYSAETNSKDIDMELLQQFLRYRRFIMFAVFYEQIKQEAPKYLQQMKEELISGSPAIKPDYLI